MNHLRRVEVIAREGQKEMHRQRAMRRIEVKGLVACCPSLASLSLSLLSLSSGREGLLEVVSREGEAHDGRGPAALRRLDAFVLRRFVPVQRQAPLSVNHRFVPRQLCGFSGF